MANFIDMIWYLESLGIADVLLPFLLVFTVAFAILARTQILGKEAKRFNVILALAMAFAVVIPHVLGTYPPGMDVVFIINAALPQVAVVIIAVILLLLMIGAFGAKWKVGDSGAGGIVVIFSILTILYIFGVSAGWFGRGFPPWLWFLADSETVSLLITILVFGVVVWLITREEKKKDDKKPGFMKTYFDTDKLDN